MRSTETDKAIFDLASWLKDIRDRRNVRVSARENGEWIAKRELVERNTDEYELNPNAERTVRYYFKDDGNKRVEKWFRYKFTKTTGKFVKETADDGLKIVLEIQASIVGATPPWDGAETVVLSPDILVAADESDGFKPVNAKRVAGLEEEKKRLNRVLDPTRKDWGLAEETGVLLEGPPGTGKTELVMEVCQERYGSMPVMISGPEFLSKWVGESEKMLRKKFDEAKATHHKVIYIDEIDAITRDRSEILEDYSARIVSQLLVLLDGVEAKQKTDEERPLKVIASTNIPHIVDDALKRPGRLGARPIHFERPNEAARQAILHHYLEAIHTSKQGELGQRLQQFVTGEDLDVLDEIVTKTEGFTGANLEDLIQETVSRIREQGHDRLGFEMLERVYEDSFSSYNELLTLELTEADLVAVDGIDISPDVLITEIADTASGQEHALDIAKTYFDLLSDRVERDFKYTFRTTSPQVMLEDDFERSKTNTIEAFDHSEGERVCLYLKDTDKLACAQEYSSLVDDLIGVINEQLLQWEEENLLILDPMSESERNRFTSIEI